MASKNGEFHWHRLPRAVVALLLSAAAIPLSAQEAESQDPGQKPSAAIHEDPAFSDEIEVQLFRIPVRALDHKGARLPGLDASDFRVRVGGREVPVVAVDWISPEEVAKAEASKDSGIDVSDSPPLPARLIVIYVQRSQLASRNLGLQRMLIHVPEILDGLRPVDRVAVFSFEYRLKLISDFTSDRDSILEALERAVFSRESETVPSADSPSISAVLDTERAHRAGFVEDGLGVVADALAHFPGEKIMLFVGWGIGIEHGGHPTPRYREAVRKLTRASVTVSSLVAPRTGPPTTTVTNLTKAIPFLAKDTGGVSASLGWFPYVAARRMRHIFDGYYEVFFRVPSVRYTGRIRITLKRGPFTVHHARYSVTATASN